jgi:hypothetical protein
MLNRYTKDMPWGLHLIKGFLKITVYPVVIIDFWIQLWISRHDNDRDILVIASYKVDLIHPREGGILMSVRTRDGFSSFNVSIASKPSFAVNTW